MLFIYIISMTIMTDFGHKQLTAPLFPLVNLKLMECCLSNTEIIAERGLGSFYVYTEGRETDLSSGLCQYSDLGSLQTDLSWDGSPFHSTAVLAVLWKLILFWA